LKHIIITGDSWACGEWSNANTGADAFGWGIIDQGITKLFSNHGYHVINLGCPGGDAWGLLQPLYNFLWINTHLDIHRIYYFQTDIGRSFTHRSVPVAECNHDLAAALDQMYTELYAELDRIAHERSVKIHVIGGLTDVTVSFTAFENLVLESESWCRLLDPNLALTNVVDQKSIEFLAAEFPQHQQQLLPLIEQCLARKDFFNHNPHWFPDHYHPNAHAHNLLFQKILPGCLEP